MQFLCCWLGWALCYYVWLKNYKFSYVLSAASAGDMLGMYDTMHEADITKYILIGEEMKSKTALSIIMILTAAAGWGVIGVFSRPLSAAGLDAIQITFIRSIAVVVAMGI